MDKCETCKRAIELHGTDEYVLSWYCGCLKEKPKETKQLRFKTRRYTGRDYRTWRR